MSETIANAVAKRDNTPGGLIKQYSADFASVLPSHVKAETWVRLAQGAMKKGKRIDDQRSPQHGMFELEAAAINNPGAFLAALLDAARQGLEPGTEQYYLTPRKVKGKLEILGITGYQGHIELMYRAGAVTAVVAEVVREHDDFEYAPGQLDREDPQRPRWIGPQTVPFHRYPNFASEESRGRLIGVYAYAHMAGGAVSRVVRLGVDDINRIKKSSASATYDSSPWVNHEVAMWLKSAVRQLQKWVPTSPEFRREQLRAAAEAQRVAAAPGAPAGADAAQTDYIDGDFTAGHAEDPAAVPTPPAGGAAAGDDGGWPATAQPGTEAPR